MYLNSYDNFVKLSNVDLVKLKGKIRTNKEINSFLKYLFDRNKANRNYNYNNVSVIYANTFEELECQLLLYDQKGFKCINYTPSNFKPSVIDRFSNYMNAHQAIGQEFEKVITYITDKFFYNQYKELNALNAPNPEYSYVRMLFQAVTRTREKIAIIVYNNPTVYEEIMELFGYLKK